MCTNHQRKRTLARRSLPGDPAATWSRRRSAITVSLVAAILAWTMLVLTPTPMYAAEVRQGEAIIVPAGETVEDDLYAFGQSVTIHGTVNGDVIAAGQSVTVDGTVTGDLMAAGGSVVVAGTVGGAARLAGQSVEINAPVGHDLLVGAATVNIGPRALIGRDLLAGGNTVTIGGPVGRSIRAGAESLLLGARVGGDVQAQAGTLRLTREASIQGSLSYASSQEAVIEPGASVRGMTSHLETEAVPAAPSPAALFAERAFGWVKMLVGLAVLGLALVTLFPGFMHRSADTLTTAPWASFGLGFGVLVGAPVAGLLLFVVGLLIGGWWLGPAVLALALMMLPVSCAIVGLFLGRLMMVRAGRPGVASGWSLLAGLVVLGVVSLVPLAGGVAILAALMFGLGACVLALTATYREPRVVTAPPPPDETLTRMGEPIPAR